MIIQSLTELLRDAHPLLTTMREMPHTPNELIAAADMDLFGMPTLVPSKNRRGRPPKTTPSPSVCPIKTLEVSREASATVAPVIALYPTTPPTAETAETMAQALEQHPDYRILRRLQPRLDFPLPPEGLHGPCATVLLLDTETTGLEASREHIIELAMLRVQIDGHTGCPFGHVTVYDGFEDPGCPIPPAITELTGIRDADVRGQRFQDEHIHQLLKGVDVVIAHNASFDRPFVEARFPAFAQLAWACSWADIDWKSAGHSSAKLEHLAARSGWFYDAHRANADCHALLTVLAQPRQGDTGTHLNTLLTVAGQSHHKVYATGAPFETKDLLKSRGYRWDNAQRVWVQLLRSDADLETELLWLTDHVYLDHPSRVRVETLDARHRYSTRSGVSSMRLVGTSVLLTTHPVREKPRGSVRG